MLAYIFIGLGISCISCLFMMRTPNIVRYYRELKVIKVSTLFVLSMLVLELPVLILMNLLSAIPDFEIWRRGQNNVKK